MKIFNKEFITEELKKKKSLKENLEITFYKLQGQVDYLEAILKEMETSSTPIEEPEK